ncbi:hypothetical protein GCM10010295_63340 [Streptomyces intermedius]
MSELVLTGPSYALHRQVLPPVAGPLVGPGDRGWDRRWGQAPSTPRLAHRTDLQAPARRQAPATADTSSAEPERGPTIPAGGRSGP